MVHKLYLIKGGFTASGKWRVESAGMMSEKPDFMIAADFIELLVNKVCGFPPEPHRE